MRGSASVVDDAYRFAPAAPDESLVFGACSPGWHTAASQETAIDQWVSFMQRRDVDRVCCLLTGRQLGSRDANVGRYREAFGSEQVCHAPVPDGHLADVDTLRGDVLPFLDSAVADGSRVVVHCLAGIGRTGHVLAAWLVHGRGYAPHDAIDAVRATGRDPLEAVEYGNATRQDVLDTLSHLS